MSDGSILTLDAPGARDPAIAGIKAARLAEARAAGLPVLPGLVVPVSAGAGALAAGQRQLEQPGGEAGARLAVLRAAIPSDLRALHAQAASLGDELVARSSTGLDDDPRMSGAFASYLEVSPADLTTAVRGCWASQFAPGVLARLQLSRLDVADVGLAVLIQPLTRPQVGGWARDIGGSTEIVGAVGGPAPLLAGHIAGTRVSFERGEPARSIPELSLSASTVRALVEMVRATGMDDVRVEWAVVDGAPLLLQVGRALAPAEAPRGPDVGSLQDPAFRGPAYVRMARLLADRRGRLSDEIIAPWAASATLESLPLPADGSARELLDMVEQLARMLCRQSEDQVHLPCGAIVERLSTGDAALADRLSAQAVDAEAAGRLLGAVDGLGAALARSGRLPSPHSVWWQTLRWLRDAVGEGSSVPPTVRPADRWGPLVYSVTSARGRRLQGLSAVPGQAVGRAIEFKAREWHGPSDGMTLVAARPDQRLAPFLWNAAALVTAGGSPAAHICEVARALHVPAVVSVGVHAHLAGSVVAVDGSSGEVAVWDPESVHA